MAKNVLVFAERRDGELKRAALEAIGAARGLAETLGGSVVALALGPGAAGVAEAVGAAGAATLYVAEDAHLETYAVEAYAACLAAAANEAEAGVVLVPATILGKDLAPRATARLGSAMLSELVEVAVDAGGALSGVRPVYSGKAMARVKIPSARPAVATLRPNVFAAGSGGAGAAEVRTLACPVAEGELKVRTTSLRQSEQQELDVAEASIVVSGGRGLKEPGNFSYVRDLAQALGGAVGASRAVVDEGWIPHAHQVGQTGKVVSPNLYVAVGISGAIQHLAGMSSSKVIVAINKDPEAPIFKVADYGIVGDLFEIVPAVTEAVKALD